MNTDRIRPLAAALLLATLLASCSEEAKPPQTKAPSKAEEVREAPPAPQRLSGGWLVLRQDPWLPYPYDVPSGAAASCKDGRVFLHNGDAPPSWIGVVVGTSPVKFDHSSLP
ncbi:hypothetical protein HQ560_08700, partial [bacterium]|nr:hypothetical protein [bacterium]